MQIFVTDSNGKKLTVEIAPHASIDSLFSKISAMHPASATFNSKLFSVAGSLAEPKPFFGLTFNGIRLELGNTLKDYGLQHESILHISYIPNQLRLSNWQEFTGSFLSKMKNEFLSYCSLNKIVASNEEHSIFSRKNTLQDLLNFLDNHPNSVVGEFFMSKGLLVKNLSLIKCYNPTTCYDGTKEFILSNTTQNRWYPDEYLIASILQKYHQERGASDCNFEVIYEPWQGSSRGKNSIDRGSKNTDLINDQIINHINRTRYNTKNRLIFVPFLYGYHHPGITILIKGHEKKAIYLDPFGDDPHYPEVNDLINKLKLSGITVDIVKTEQQKGLDGSSCGPILTASMFKFTEEYLATGTITKNNFPKPRLHLATDRLFQMYVNNEIRLEHNDSGFEELMLADPVLWKKFLKEQQISKTISKAIQETVAIQQRFIATLSKNKSWKEDPSVQKALDFIQVFQSYIIESVFLNKELCNSLQPLLNRSNTYFNNPTDVSTLEYTFIRHYLLDAKYIFETHKILGIETPAASTVQTQSADVPAKTKMPIFLTLFTGKIISFEVYPDDSVDHVFAMISERLDPAPLHSKSFQVSGTLAKPAFFRLVFTGRELKSGKTLGDYGIKKDSNLYYISMSANDQTLANWEAYTKSFLTDLKKEFFSFCCQMNLALSNKESDLFNKNKDVHQLLKFLDNNPDSFVGDFLVAKGLLVKKEITPKVDNPPQEPPSNTDTSPSEIRKLLNLIEHKCSNFNYWKTKVRAGYGTPVDKDTKIPQAVAQILDMIKNFQGNDQDLLKNIGKLAEYKHSAHFQWAHAFFRGRDEQTNKFYGILARLGRSNANQEVVMNQIMKELENHFEDQTNAETVKTVINH